MGSDLLPLYVAVFAALIYIFICASRYITSDSGAVHDISGAHKYKNMTPEEGTAAALLAGCDINSGSQYAQYVEKAVKDGLVNESVVDDALVHAFKTRIRLVCPKSH